MKIQNNGFLSLEQLQNQYLGRSNRQVQGTVPGDGLSFQDI